METTTIQAAGCDFCRIGRGEDDSADILCEGATWVAFFPTEPATLGHTLVIPRMHVPDVWALPAELAHQLMDAVIQVGHAIRAATTPAGMNLISSSGAAAEQTVYHVHLHVVPRYEGDNIDPIWPPKVPMDESLKFSVADRIRVQCAQNQRL